MQSEKTQAQKAKYCTISFSMEYKNVKPIEAENSIVVTKVWGGAKWKNWGNFGESTQNFYQTEIIN